MVFMFNALMAYKIEATTSLKFKYLSGLNEDRQQPFKCDEIFQFTKKEKKRKEKGQRSSLNGSQ